jgi:hypothetical protein
MKERFMKALSLAAALLLVSGAALADTTVTTTTTRTPEGVTTVEKTVTDEKPATGPRAAWSSEEHTILTPGTRAISFADLDINRDGILSVGEVGRRLFKLFDGDGNEVLDNAEWERKSVLTVMPQARDTVIAYDFDGDGLADQVQRTYDVFLRDSMLSRFDQNGDGLSPHEFTGRDFLAADVNHDKAVDLQEWQGTYIAALDRENKEKARFNK